MEDHIFACDFSFHSYLARQRLYLKNRRMRKGSQQILQSRKRDRRGVRRMTNVSKEAKNELIISVNMEDLDKAIEKANRLKEILEEVQSLTHSLFNPNQKDG